MQIAVVLILLSAVCEDQITFSN